MIESDSYAQITPELHQAGLSRVIQNDVHAIRAALGGRNQSFLIFDTYLKFGAELVRKKC